MRFFVMLPYWQLVLIRLIPGAIFLIIFAIGIYEMPEDPMPYVLFLAFRAAAISAFFHSIIDCGWWWSVTTSIYNKYPTLVGAKVYRIKRLILLLFCIYMIFSIGIFSFTWILHIFIYYKTIAVIIFLILCLLILVCQFTLRSFLIKTLKEISTKFYKEEIDDFNFSFFNPVSAWGIQKMIYKIFRKG
jgi:hypothetical protein